MQGQGDLKKNPAGLEQLKKISSSLKILQLPHQKSNGPPLKLIYWAFFFLKGFSAKQQKTPKKKEIIPAL